MNIQWNDKLLLIVDFETKLVFIINGFKSNRSDLSLWNCGYKLLAFYSYKRMIIFTNLVKVIVRRWISVIKYINYSNEWMRGSIVKE